tara:strand:- start:1563 stop:2318 length:756 start_codon:yes stop_codon:yes gene_type:complete
MRLKSWSCENIRECNEPLIPIPESIFRFNPHPYMLLGAPYINGATPWVLRESVVIRLIEAQQYLSAKSPFLQLAIFDAWRPIPVQEFMFNYTINETCKLRDIDIKDPSSSRRLSEVVEEVSRFWAQPSYDPSTPPPHSTGAAIDLTLADMMGNPLDLGGDIDLISEKSKPDFYEKNSLSMPGSKYEVFHNRRLLLKTIMISAGFAQHPNEWWHFSYGDQLWCWRSKKNKAIYGAAFDVSNESTLSAPRLVT